jgi:hypothetical protein
MHIRSASSTTDSEADDATIALQGSAEITPIMIRTHLIQTAAF